MGNKLYVGNLSYGVSNVDLEQMFSAHGAVRSAMVVMDRETGRSKGFGFVEMGSDQEAQTAINALNGKEISGRTLTVNEARPKEEGGPRGGRLGDVAVLVEARRRSKQESEPGRVSPNVRGGPGRGAVNVLQVRQGVLRASVADGHGGADEVMSPKREKLQTLARLRRPMSAGRHPRACRA